MILQTTAQINLQNYYNIIKKLIPLGYFCHLFAWLNALYVFLLQSWFWNSYNIEQKLRNKNLGQICVYGPFKALIAPYPWIHMPTTEK